MIEIYILIVLTSLRHPWRYSPMSLFRRTAEAALYCACPFNSPYMLKGSLVDPRLRASNEHVSIVRVPRAGGRLGCHSHSSEAVRCASTEDHQPPSPLIPPSSLAFFTGGWPVWPPTARNFLTRPPTGTPRRAINPTSTFLSCAFREQRRTTGYPPILLISPYFALKGSRQTVLHCARPTRVF